jgi:HEPN domain-containing protein
MTPSKQERLFERGYAKELMRIAQGDLKTAEALAPLREVRIENAIYHIQQAIEKGLKAVLIAKELKVPLVHDLGVLIGKLPEDAEPPFGYELQQLTEFATIRRYEEGEWKITKEELESTLVIGRKMLAWAENIVFDE